MSIDVESVQIPEPQAQPAPVLPPPQLKAMPVVAAERVASVDVLRGVALLGILAMNIVGFAWPFAAYDNPLRGGGFFGLNRGIWIFNHLVFDGKMMTIFSMLFGAGLVLMGDRADARGASLGWTYYRRVFWLLVFGALHGYFLWSGDILFFYAQCGFVLYPFRRRSAPTLIIVGILFLLVVVVFGAAIQGGLGFLEMTSHQAQAARQDGRHPTKFQAWIDEVWTQTMLPKVVKSSEKKAEQFTKEIETFRGSYGGIVRHNIKELIGAQTFGFIFFLLWMVGGRMLLGMGLMKMGVFAASRSRRFYVWMVLLGYGIGLPLLIYDTYALIEHDFHYKHSLPSMYLFNYFGSILVALGHVGVVMLICQAGAIPWLTRRLAAVGRMALTNYLTQSLICTAIFYGWGLGLFATMDRTELAGVVLAIWIFQLLISPVWLAFFRFGPAEWLWRSLTYWRLQPIRRAVEPALA
jgi:uncharacterized protein